MLKYTSALALLPLVCAFSADLHPAAKPSTAPDPLFLTATNANNNFLAVINTRTKQTTFVPTGGNGGVSGNAGGIAVSGSLAAVINFGSSNVTIFNRVGNAMQPVQMVKTTSQPVSVAFGNNHLVVLGMTTAESFPVYGTTVGANDGIVQLLRGDKSAAQIAAFDGGVVYAEKSGDVATISLSTDGFSGLSGTSAPVPLPAAPNNDTPFGIAARGANVYLAIAHSDLEALIVNGQIVSMATGPTPFKNQSGGLTHAPCWNALSGHFLFSADSPGKQLLRYLVSDSNIFFDKGAVATLAGSPSDLDIQGNLLGVIDGGDSAGSNVSLFNIDSEGELTLQFTLKIPSQLNGAAIIR